MFLLNKNIVGKMWNAQFMKNNSLWKHVCSVFCYEFLWCEHQTFNWGFVCQKQTWLFFLNLCEHVTTVHCLSVEVLFRSQLWMWCGDSNGGIGVRPVCFYGQLFWRSMVAGWGAQQYSAPSRDTPVSDDAGVGKQDLPVHWKRPWTLHPICCMITRMDFAWTFRGLLSLLRRWFWCWIPCWF